MRGKTDGEAEAETRRNGGGDAKELHRERRRGERRCQGRGAAGAGAGRVWAPGYAHLSSSWWPRSEPRACPPPPPAFVLRRERVPVGRERPLPSLEGRAAESTQTPRPEPRRPWASPCPLAVRRGSRPRERTGGNLRRPAPLLGPNSKPLVRCFLCRCFRRAQSESRRRRRVWVPHPRRKPAARPPPSTPPSPVQDSDGYAEGKQHNRRAGPPGTAALAKG